MNILYTIPNVLLQYKEKGGKQMTKKTGYWTLEGYKGFLRGKWMIFKNEDQYRKAHEKEAEQRQKQLAQDMNNARLQMNLVRL